MIHTHKYFVHSKERTKLVFVPDPLLFARLPAAAFVKIKTLKKTKKNLIL